jgi:hypothetical protein
MSLGAPRLMTRVIVATSVVFLVPAIIAATIYTTKLREDMERIALDRLEERGEYAADYLARLLYKEWSKVESIAGSLDLSEPAKISARFAEIVQVDRRFSSFDLADLSGKVIASSANLYKGGGVTNELWFRRGLEGPFIGDPEDDPTLTALVPARVGHASRFIEFALPVKKPNGDVAGVLGVHVEWFWVRDLLGVLRMDDAQAILLSRDRKVLYTPKNMDEKSILMTPAFAASQVARVSRLERDPSGAAFLTVVVPNIRYKGLPDLGWSLVVRQDVAQGFAFMKSLFRRLWTAIGLAAAVTLMGVCVMAWCIARPLEDIASFAVKLSENKNAGPPPEPTGCLETRQLTTALAVLQSRLETKEGRAAP